MMVIPTTIVLRCGYIGANGRKAHEDLKIARDKGVDIIAAFRNDFQSVKDFEKKINGVKLPQDICADMLTNEPPRSAITPKI